MPQFLALREKEVVLASRHALITVEEIVDDE